MRWLSASDERYWLLGAVSWRQGPTTPPRLYHEAIVVALMPTSKMRRLLLPCIQLDKVHGIHTTVWTNLPTSWEFAFSCHSKGVYTCGLGALWRSTKPVFFLCMVYRGLFLFGPIQILVHGKLKVWIRRVWTLEMSVIGLR